MVNIFYQIVELNHCCGHLLVDFYFHLKRIIDAQYM